MEKSTDIFSIELPYWVGVLENPILNIPVTPFSIRKDESGFYKQINTETIDKIINNYSSNEYAHISTPPGESSWANSLTNQSLEYLRKNSTLKGKKVLDIAGVNSYIADILFEKDNIESYTLINPNLHEENYNSKITCIKGYFPEAFDCNLKFDVVLLFNCLDHVQNPQSFLEEIKKILNNDGVLVLKIQDNTSHLINGDFNGLLHEHLFYFTSESFKIIAKKAGFSVSDCFMQENAILASLKKEAKDNFSEKIVPPEFDLTIFNKQIEYSKNLFRDLIQKERKIIIHGACNGIATLSSILKPEIDISDIQVVDIDEKKHNKFLPGFKKPILFPDEVSSENIDFVIVGSATFINSIKNYWVSRCINENNVLTMYKPKK